MALMNTLLSEVLNNVEGVVIETCSLHVIDGSYYDMMFESSFLGDPSMYDEPDVWPLVTTRSTLTRIKDSGTAKRRSKPKSGTLRQHFSVSNCLTVLNTYLLLIVNQPQHVVVYFIILLAP